MPTSPWVYLISLAYAGVVTGTARWLVMRRRKTRHAGWASWHSTWADLIWMLLMLAAGLLVYRYAERVHHSGAFYAACAGLLGLLALVRAVLFRRVDEQSTTADTPVKPRD